MANGTRSSSKPFEVLGGSSDALLAAMDSDALTAAEALAVSSCAYVGEAMGAGERPSMTSIKARVSSGLSHCGMLLLLR